MSAVNGGNNRHSGNTDDRTNGDTVIHRLPDISVGGGDGRTTDTITPMDTTPRVTDTTHSIMRTSNISDISDGMENFTCKMCGQHFLAYVNNPSNDYCPDCDDILKDAPATIIAQHEQQIHDRITDPVLRMSDKINRGKPRPVDTTTLIDILFENFAVFLKEKNRRYGDSALHPAKIFSKDSANSQLCNRLDDKLNRIKNSDTLRKNDVSDVFGYVALLLISNNWLAFDDLLD